MDLGVRGCEEATEIGRGAFGVVYRARQTLYNRTVAVKVLPVLDDKARGRFDREREAMGALSSHPNIVSVYDSGTTPDGRSYLVMDFMAGGTLAERLAQQGPISWAEVTALGVKLAGALEAAHGAGVLHRDLKPENALISAYGEPALADFGIARVQGAARSTTGAITGTLAYIAPEILAGRPPSAQSDVYGLGSTLFALLAGGPAFIYDTDESIMPAIRRIADDPVPDLRSRGVPDALCRVIEQAMAKDPADRFPTALAFGRALQSSERAGGLPGTQMVLRLPSPARSEDTVVGATIGPVGPAPSGAPPYHRSTTTGVPAGAGLSMGETVDRALAELERMLGQGPTSEHIAALRTEFAEPLRVAVAGPVNAGKSTLVNALLRRQVAPIEAGGCASFVTWYRCGLPERLEVVLASGERVRRSWRDDGSVPVEIEIPAGAVHHLDIFLANDELERMTVIDTPGLTSAVDRRAGATRELVALDRDSRAAVSQADVLLLVMALDAGAGDDDFEAQFDGLPRTALNAVAVLSCIDLLDTPSADVRARAAALASRLRTPVAAVVPVATRLAETIECGLLSEEDVAELSKVAQLDDAGRAAWPLTPSLLERLGRPGLTVALDHLQAHGPGAAALLRRLRQEAGIDACRERVAEAVGRHGDVLKCARLLNTLARAGDDGAVLAALEPLLWLDPSLLAVRLQRAAQLHSAGEAALPARLAQELHTLAGGTSETAAAGDTTAVAAAVSRWRTYANSGRAGAAEREVADAVCRAYELEYERITGSR